MNPIFCLTSLHCFILHWYYLLQSFVSCMDVIFDHSPHTHITSTHFDLDIDLIVDLFKQANFLVNPFGLFHLTLIPLATKLKYLHWCYLWLLSTHPHHMTTLWPWHWPNFNNNIDKATTGGISFYWTQLLGLQNTFWIKGF